MDRRARIGFGAGNLLIAASIAFGVFRLLPTRWWVVDSGAVVVVLLLGASGVALLRDMPAAERITRIAAMIVLAVGVALVTALVVAASTLSGIYGAVGATGAILFVLVLLLVLPYVVVFPAVELVWIGPRARKKT